MTSHLKLLCVCVLLAFSFLASALNQVIAAESSAAFPTEFSEEKIEAFVNAAIDVAIINTAAKDAFDKATNRAEQDSIIASARREMNAAITQAPGITMDEYIEISTAAEANPTFAQDLNARALEKFKLLDDAHGAAE